MHTAQEGRAIMAKKLAITISGAVSLGSYEAGVLFEVLDAIRQHNTNAATTEDSRIEIDVLTGASAGGMTAIILAQKLLYGGDEFVGPYDNPLYNTWVERISLEGLQRTAADEPALHSIFSSNLIEAISKETLLGRYAVSPPKPAQRHAAAAQAIRVGVAMTNLNGVEYGYPVLPSGEFVYLNYGDQRTRLVDSTDPACDTEAFWGPLRQAAVASGAFPMAFRPQDMQRSRLNEPDDYLGGNLRPWPEDPMTFTYSDGGILQNEPLGMAKNLVDKIDAHLGQDQRFYLFVSPHEKDPQANEVFHAPRAGYLRMMLRLLDVTLGQSGFQDWITAQAMNKRVELLDQRAAELSRVIQAGQIDVPALGTTAETLLSLFFQGGSHLSPGATERETLDDAKSRIAHQYRAEMAMLGDGSPQSLAFRDAVLAFETAAGLGARDVMTIYGVTAKDTELASAGLQSFLGFFDQKFRDHDYDVGRTHAHEVLIDPALGNPGAIGPLRYVGSPIRPIDAALNGLKLGAAPPEDVKAFRLGMKRRLNEMLREQEGLGGLLAEPGTDILWDLFIKHLTARL
jgi:predicted acylesterase/phospholipase RssA